jgi:exosortase B
MSRVLDRGPVPVQAVERWAHSAPWWVALVGLAVLYLPSYWAALRGLWQSDDFAHAPLMLAIALFLFWQARQNIRDAPARPMPWAGWPLLALGLLCYLVGRAFDISSVEFGSQVLVVAAMLLLLKGPAALRAAWFAVFYLLFMIPLPGSLVDAVTGPLKHWVSSFVVEVLYALGYPIARTGVMISVGQYQLLVADACSGLNSMISLSALGTLYLYLTTQRDMIHRLVMLLLIIPIAFVANLVRVAVLVLVTYHLGDEAGQGFLHGFAGILLMLAALVMLFLADRLLSVLCRPGP